MELNTKHVPKRKRQKTRKCLDQIRQRSRRNFEDVPKKSSNYTNKKTCIKLLKNSRCSNFITNNRLTLKMIPKIIWSETVARFSTIDSAIKQLKGSLNNHIKQSDGLVNSILKSIDSNNSVQSKKGDLITSSNESSDSSDNLNYNIFNSDYNSPLVSFNNDSELDQRHVDSEKYYNYYSYMKNSNFFMNHFPAYIEKRFPQLLAPFVLDDTNIFHRETALQMELKGNLTSLKEYLDNTITTKWQPAKNDAFIDGSTNFSSGCTLEHSTSSSIFSTNSDVISQSNVSITSHHNVPITPDFNYYPHILK